MIKRYYLRNFLTVLLLLFSNLLIAQPGDPGDGDPEDIPLDPGTWVLVAAGVGYGLKKWKDANQNNKKDKPDTTADFLPGNKTNKDC